MPKKIVISFDGTWNTPGVKSEIKGSKSTNVLKLHAALLANDSNGFTSTNGMTKALARHGTTESAVVPSHLSGRSGNSNTLLSPTLNTSTAANINGAAEMKKDDVILLLAGLGGVAAIVALSIPLIWALIQPKPVKPTGKPEGFVYDYPWGEFAGERLWSQMETGGWREVYPNGTTVNYYNEVRREKLERCEGTVVEREDSTNFKVLIADRGCEKMWLFYQIGNGVWQFMGVMKSVR